MQFFFAVAQSGKNESNNLVKHVHIKSAKSVCIKSKHSLKNTSLRTWTWGKTPAYKTLFALQRTQKINVIFKHKLRPAEILSLCTSNHFPPSVHFSKNFPVARLAERSLCTSNRGLGYQIVTAARETVKQYIFAETAFWKYGSAEKTKTVCTKIKTQHEN